MLSFCTWLFSLFLLTVSNADVTTYNIHMNSPSTGATLEPAPIGVSLEFFTFPSYLEDVIATTQCLQNLNDLTGVMPPLRIGGTTQDRATYDPSMTSQYVAYSVPSPSDAPLSLSFGPKFIALAGAYKGSVVLGLNRRENNILNIIAAAQEANNAMPNLLAIELGNEPDFYASSEPISGGASWTPQADAESQDDWGIQVGQAMSRSTIIQSGNFFAGPPTWGAGELIATENDTARGYVNEYAQHIYPGGSVDSLMSHAQISAKVGAYSSDIAAANNAGMEYVLGETNSVAGGGGADVCPTFGAALWVMDFSLRAASSNIKRLYFHQGTIGYCYYCWWGRYSMGQPYYGAYFATSAMANGARITALDDGNSNYAGYGIYDDTGKPMRAVLYNSDYYDGSGVRGSHTFNLTGISTSSIQAKRLTAQSALSRADWGQPATFGSQGFEDGTCRILGVENYETVTVENESALFTLLSSEALLVYF